ncbi:hypothetical protein C2845_PM02G20700 [Panicum miliaceum]|uniref:Pectin acetylesterase n=1 Tax=Panicum miliaceum TaxID=4540 RepID=A0A3L6S8S4_PANMI|nr:hypothetical protein C2845_PM02G20700 [Panicum miliaceum]
MAPRRRGACPAAAVFVAAVVAVGFAAEAADMVQERLTVGMTIVADAASTGAGKSTPLPFNFSRSFVPVAMVCLDGSPPAYHLHRGSGAGARSWLLQFEGGGWCNDVRSCTERAGTRRGSTRLMTKVEVFSGILSNRPSMNPDCRVPVPHAFIFGRDLELPCHPFEISYTPIVGGKQRMLPFLLVQLAFEKGDSAIAIMDSTSDFYNWNRVKLRYCDGGSFSGDSEYKNGSSVLYFRGQRIWDAIITDLLQKGLAKAKNVLLSGCSAGGLATFFHCDSLKERLGGATTGVQKNLNKDCQNSTDCPYMCFFPQYALPDIRTPYFILNSAYDVYQFHHIFVPPSSDPGGQWSRCLRSAMLTSLKQIEGEPEAGMFVNSCFAHCQSELQDTWFAPDSPMIHDKVIVIHKTKLLYA